MGVLTISQLPPGFHAFAQTLPAPLGGDEFRLLKRGIDEQGDIDVFINAASDFACLYPTPEYRYDDYATASRAQRLGLKSYQVTTNRKHEQRFAKIGPLLNSASSFLEIGAAGAEFLSFLHERMPGLRYGSFEVDQSLRAARAGLGWLMDFPDFESLHGSGQRFDVIGMFHVLEHIPAPQRLLADCIKSLAPGGRIIIEVPSLSDPLLSLYDCGAYRQFYFQRQHPYVYSGPSLKRMLEASGLAVETIIPFQRYGLENHLQWLARGKPGGHDAFRALFPKIEGGYREAFETEGIADTVIAVASVLTGTDVHS